MKTVNLAEAEAKISELLRMVAEGESVTIAEQGTPVARLTPVPAPRQRVDIELLRRVSARFPRDQESTETFMRRMRDDERY